MMCYLTTFFLFQCVVCFSCYFVCKDTEYYLNDIILLRFLLEINVAIVISSNTILFDLCSRNDLSLC